MKNYRLSQSLFLLSYFFSDFKTKKETMAGQLSVTIVEARNLKDEDTVGGSNDAYVEVYIDEDYKQRTATISNSNNPQWNESFEL